MATVKVEVKVSGRNFPRVWTLEHEDFETVKNAVRDAGGRYNGQTQRWTVPGNDWKSLKYRFSATRADFSLTMCNAVLFTATEEVMWTPPTIDASGLAADARNYREQAEAIRNRMQEAYNESEEALKEFLEAL
jgi:signal recognition particle subunit SEC65